MPQKMFRLTEAEINTIKRVARERGCTHTDVIRSCIAEIESDTQEDTHRESEKIAFDTEWKDLYLAEKKRNDELSDRLLELSGKITDAFRAEKVTEAFDAGARVLESSDQKEKRPWWRFWG